MEDLREKLGITEYEEVLLDNISTVVIPRAYIEDNAKFFDSVIFKMFEVYYYSRTGVSIKEQARMLELFVSNLFEHKPSVEKPLDILNLD